MTRPPPRWHGALLIDKPEGITSHDVVDTVRRLSGQRRIGHAGTLDPLATGLLVLVLGSATRLVRFLSSTPKVYRTVARLGFETDTEDITGNPVTPVSTQEVSDSTLEAAIATLRATRSQVPPVYSAKKIDGRTLHRAARAGIILTPKPVPIRLDELVVLSRDQDRVELEIHCSPGTYVRSLVRDLGRLLGCGATVASLRRFRSGTFDVAASSSPEALVRPGELERAIVPLADLPLAVPRLSISASAAREFVQGREIAVDDPTEGDVALHCDSHLVGIGHARRGDGQTGIVSPRVVMMSVAREAVL